LQTRCSPHSIVAKLATKSNSTAPSCGVISGRSKRVGLANDRQKSIPTQLRKNRTCAFLDRLSAALPRDAMYIICPNFWRAPGWLIPAAVILSGTKAHVSKPTARGRFRVARSTHGTDFWSPGVPARAIPDLRSQQSLVFDRRFGQAIGTDRGSENLIQVGQSWS
jgi:hypothetical protein